MTLVTTTPADVLADVVKELGGVTGTLADNATGTTVTLSALQGAYGYDDALKGRLLIFPENAAVDRHRFITAWDDSAGQATVDTMSDTPVSGEAFWMPAPGDPTLVDLERACKQAMQEWTPTWRVMEPTRAKARRYTFAKVDWLQTWRDILGVWERWSPNLIDNEDFTVWPDGPATTPYGWAINSGTFQTNARSTADLLRSDVFSWSLASTGGGVVEYEIPLLDAQLRSKTIQAQITMVAGDAGSRMRLTDGVSASSWDTHDGDDDIQDLTVSDYEPAATAESLFMQVECAAGDDIRVSEPIAVEGSSIPDWLKDQGSGGAPDVTDVQWWPEQQGPRVAVRLDHAIGRGHQLLISTRGRPAAYSALTDTVDIPVAYLKAQTIVNLADQHRKGEAKDRWDSLLAVWAPRAARYRRAMLQAGSDPMSTHRGVEILPA